jgi:hypothetical protein
MTPEASLDLSPLENRRATTPRAGAIAGLLFAVAFSCSVVLIRLSVSGASSDTGEWLNEGAGWFSFAIALMPFAGIFFLWFIAVARARLGRLEDQFFATVFLGSGLIFIAMVFVAAGVAGTIVTGYARDPATYAGSTSYYEARDLVVQTFAIYAMRMAAVFVITQATLWRRTKVMPRWMALLTYAVGLVLLLALTQSIWFVLVFPAWVFLVSLYILIRSFARPEEGVADGMTPRMDESVGG